MSAGRTDSAAEVREYGEGWYRMMTRIWTDRIGLMGAIRTGTLRGSVTGAGLSVTGFDMQATFRFVQYGLYVDAGTGNGYRRGNGGRLEILDREYRQRHGLKRQRKARPWFSRSWRISREVLKDRLAGLMGEAFTGLFDEISG